MTRVDVCLRAVSLAGLPQELAVKLTPNVVPDPQFEVSVRMVRKRFRHLMDVMRHVGRPSRHLTHREIVAGRFV